MAVEAVASLLDIGSGKGGYWEDSAGYQWFGGIEPDPAAASGGSQQIWGSAV